MQIPSPVVPLNASATDSRDLQLRAGQRLDATVVRGAAADQPAQVRIGGNTIELRLPVTVDAGARLRFTVVEQGARNALQLVAHTPPTPAGATMPSPRPGVQVPASAIGLQGLALRAGQSLEAMVVRGTAGGQAAQMRIAGIPIDLSLPLQVNTGARLSFTVLAQGAQTTLHLLAFSPSATSSPPATPGATPGATTGLPAAPGLSIAPWLPALLPAQGSQAPLFAQLLSLLQKPVPGLPADVAAAARNAVDTLSTTAQVSRADGLREAVGRSGLFHEAMLAAVATDLNARGRPVNSIKSALLSLAARLRAHADGEQSPRAPAAAQPPPPRPGGHPVAQARAGAEPLPAVVQPALLALRGQVEQAIARLVLHQWSSSEPNESGLPRWLLELPVRNGNAVDILHCAFEAERERKRKSRERAWHAEIALDTPGLGPVHARVTVTGQNVSVRFWVLDADQAEPLQAALHRLEDALRAHQLEVRGLGCVTGPPPRPLPPPAARSGVLDDRA